MPESFDPYAEWLGISPEKRPLDYYTLLGLSAFESNRGVIQSAADQRVGRVRAFQAGPRQAVVERVLNELALASATLLNPEKQAAYDQKLRQMQAAPRSMIGKAGGAKAPASAMGKTGAARTADVKSAVRSESTLESRIAEELASSAPDPRTAIDPRMKITLPRIPLWKNKKVMGGAGGAAALVLIILLIVSLNSGKPHEEPDKLPADFTPSTPEYAKVASHPTNPAGQPKVSSLSGTNPQGAAGQPTADGTPSPTTPADGKPLDKLQEDVVEAAGLAMELRQIENTDQYGDDAESPAFQSLAPGSGLLIGVEICRTNFSNSTVVQAIRPLFLTKGGVVPGNPAGKMTSELIRNEAKPGYAVGGVVIRAGDRLDGFQLIYMRMTSAGLDPKDSYRSPWLGGMGGSLQPPIISTGNPVVGLAGAAGNTLDRLGLVVTTTTGITAGVPKKPGDKDDKPSLYAPSDIIRIDDKPAKK